MPLAIRFVATSFMVLCEAPEERIVATRQALPKKKTPNFNKNSCHKATVKNRQLLNTPTGSGTERVQSIEFVHIFMEINFLTEIPLMSKNAPNAELGSILVDRIMASCETEWLVFRCGFGLGGHFVMSIIRGKHLINIKS